MSVQFILLTFLCNFAAFGAHTLADGLFLEQVGPAGLPVAYLCISLFMVCCSFALLRGLNHLSVATLFRIITLAGVVFYGSVGLFTDFDRQWLWYACKIFGYAYTLLIYTGMWSFIDDHFELAQAQRLYGLFAAGAMAGAAAGSGWISLAISSIAPTTLLIGISATLLVACAISWRVSRRPVRVDIPEEATRPLATSWLRQIIHSPFLRYILIFNLIILLLQVVTEYHYMEAFSLHGTDHVTSFFGSCRAWVFLGNVIFAASLYGRMIGRIGLRTAIMIPPLLFLLLFAVWSWHSSLVIAVIGLVLVEGVLSTVEDSNFHLLVNSVPHRLKARLRITVEQVIEPMGIFLGSLILMISQGHRIAGLILAVVAVSVAYLLRAAYPPVIVSEETRQVVEQQNVA